MYVLSPPICRHIQANPQFDIFFVVCSYSGCGRVSALGQSERPTQSPTRLIRDSIFFCFSPAPDWTCSLYDVPAVASRSIGKPLTAEQVKGFDLRIRRDPLPTFTLSELNRFNKPICACFRLPCPTELRPQARRYRHGPSGTHLVSPYPRASWRASFPPT